MEDLPESHDLVCNSIYCESAVDLGLYQCIIMESYDTMLIGTFFAYPTFQQRFGERLANGTYSIPAEWQTLLGLSPTVGIIIGIFLNGFLIDRFGHRKVCLVSLVLLTGFFGLTVGATSKEMLLASQLLCGVP